MVEVTKKSANWRLFGGGGLVLGGVLWVVQTILYGAGQVGPSGYVGAIGLLVLAIAHGVLAFGQTGSNGIVGALLWGKAALLLAGVGWLLYALAALLSVLVPSVPEALLVTAILFIVIGGLASALAIFSRGVAKGIARWALFAPVVVTAVYFALALVGIPDLLVAAILAGLLFAATGVAYLLNRVDLPA